MTEGLNTSKGKWSLAVLRVSQTTAKVWVGTLFHTLRKPDQACVELIHPDGTRIRKDIVRKDWQRPFRYVYQRFYTTVEFENLEPDTHYEVEFIRRTDAIYREVEEWQVLRHGQFDTLPAALPAAGGWFGGETTGRRPAAGRRHRLSRYRKSIALPREARRYPAPGQELQ